MGRAKRADHADHGRTWRQRQTTQTSPPVSKDKPRQSALRRIATSDFFLRSTFSVKLLLVERRNPFQTPSATRSSTILTANPTANTCLHFSVRLSIPATT